MNKILCFYEYPYARKEFEKKFSNKEISFLKGNVQNYKYKKDFEKVEIITVFYFICFG
ncbi:hypothetical protein LDC_0690 [sediment metagenome]|uniref:Uncharacterized protein n=1 Tax=sediment metagenome TaxID=749907 RepID=D9PGP3_9ZZZZ